MPYDELLATRIRAALGPLPDLIEKKMFGGIGFLVNGNPSTGSGQVMVCGVHKNDLIVRVGDFSTCPDAGDKPHLPKSRESHGRD
ncbi:MAG: hypothetical protein HY781_00015 [Chloroflexi bacterium]|nr:hypothetical protein [Chloroflexota bacterium]